VSCRRSVVRDVLDYNINACLQAITFFLVFVGACSHIIHTGVKMRK